MGEADSDPDRGPGPTGFFFPGFAVDAAASPVIVGGSGPVSHAGDSCRLVVPVVPCRSWSGSGLSPIGSAALFELWRLPSSGVVAAGSGPWSSQWCEGPRGGAAHRPLRGDRRAVRTVRVAPRPSCSQGCPAPLCSWSSWVPNSPYSWSACGYRAGSWGGAAVGMVPCSGPAYPKGRPGR